MQYLYLMRLHKPIGIFLLLWPTLWALWLASQGKPSWYIVILFVLGVVLTRSAGCVINDFADRHVDGKVERTKDRPLATGKVRPKDALILFAILMIISFSLVIQLNLMTCLFSLGAAFVMIIYPFLKRVTHLPQLGLGIAFAFGVPMAFAAQTAQVPASAWVVFLASALWSVIYDTMYAMVDLEDDLKVGIKSTAILFGHYNQWLLALLQCVLVFLLVLIGYLFQLTRVYYFSVGLSGILFVYQQMLLKTKLKKNYFAAFKNNQWVGAIIFLGIYL